MIGFKGGLWISKSTSWAEGGCVIPAAIAACAAVLGLVRSGEVEETEVVSPLPMTDSFSFLDGVLGELRSGEVGFEAGADCELLESFCEVKRRSRSGS